MEVLQWPLADSRAAQAEGWDVFSVHTNSGAVYFDIQKLDDANVFAEDSAAIAHVYWKATSGSELHQRALFLCLAKTNITAIRYWANNAVRTTRT